MDCQGQAGKGKARENRTLQRTDCHALMPPHALMNEKQRHVGACSASWVGEVCHLAVRTGHDGLHAVPSRAVPEPSREAASESDRMR